MNQSNPVFKSRITTILTLIGMAVGLGNVWRFPYMMGSHGGSAFLLIYLLFTILLAIPALMAELYLGRKSKQGTILAFQMAYGKPGKYLGYLLVVVITLSVSYYGIVVGNVFFTAGFSSLVGFSDDHHVYSQMLISKPVGYTVAISIMILSLYVVSRDLHKGIERVSKFIMPFFLLALLYIIIHALTLPSATEHVLKFLQPDFRNFGTNQIFAALGQTFFSVGLGGTFVIVYAAYLDEKESIPTIAAYTGLGDLVASLLISLFLVPTILVFGLKMDSGPALIFETLPKLFATMPGGRIIGSMFLISIALVAWLSLIAAYEVVITSASKSTKIPRNKIVIGLGVLQCFLILPSILEPALIGILDLILGSGMQVFGGLLAVIGVTWFLKAREAFVFRASYAKNLHRILYPWTKWIIPIILTAVLISYIYLTIS